MNDRGGWSEPVYTREDIDLLRRQAMRRLERVRRRPPLLERVLSRLFGPPEEINGHDRCPTYLYRFVLGGLFGRKAYVHHFVGDDWSLDLHDHPKRFITVGLRGRYLEQTAAGFCEYRAPWIRTFPAKHRHRITVARGEDCWTLVLVGPTVRSWGFWHDGRFMEWRQFVGSAVADTVRACP